MSKCFKRVISVFMCSIMLFGVFTTGGNSLRDLFTLAAKAVSYSVGDIIEFGAYPQSRVTDASVIGRLNAIADNTDTWISYGYYSNMIPTDSMRYCDITLDGNKYRGVFFTSYRAGRTISASTASISNENDNGYYKNDIYWFQYEPLQWRVLDPQEGLVLSEAIIDSQPFNDYLLSSGTDEYNKTAYWGDAEKTHYANNYEYSSIRSWLTDESNAKSFLNTAFSSTQRALLQTAELDNSVYSSSYSAYSSVTTYDKVFLLSSAEVLNSDYGFSESIGSDTYRRAIGSDYAKCQGLYVYAGLNRSDWRLRSAGYASNTTCDVSGTGNISFYSNTSYVREGIRPALKLDLNSLISGSETSSVLSAAAASSKPYYSQGSRDYLITVSNHPDKLQFILSSGSTKTFSKTQATVIDNGDGTENWIITASLKADDYMIKARVGGAWESAAYAFSIVYDEKPVSYSVGDIIEFGSYPQSRVTDPSVVSALDSAAATWISYDYYTGSGSYSDGKMVSSDYMQYCDVTFGGAKYRGVTFTQYRPYCTSYVSSASNSYQVDNGYTVNNTYWFKYEPLKWCLLDPQSGLVLCETIIDSQPYNNFLLSTGSDEYGYTAYWGDTDESYYANNYMYSSIRHWLTSEGNAGSFLNTAFTAAQQESVLTMTLDNSANNPSYSAYDSETTYDKVFLLSYDETQNSAYGFLSPTDNDASRQAKGSDYAKYQGLYVKEENGCSDWQLRSAGNKSYYNCIVTYDGNINNCFGTNYAFSGVRPALKLDLNAVISGAETSSVLSAAPASAEPYYVQGSRDYLITVSCHPDKLQFVFSSGTTKTFSKTQAVVVDNGDGTESWTITASLKADDYMIKARVGGAWESAAFAFSIVYDEKPAVTNGRIISVRPVSDDPYYERAARPYEIKVQGKVDKIQFVNSSGTTITLSKTAAQIVNNADGTQVWTVSASLKADTYIVKSKIGTVWIDSDYSYIVTYDARPAVDETAFTVDISGKTATFSVTTAANASKIQFVTDSGSTITFSAADYSVIGADGLRHWTIVRTVKASGTGSYALKVKTTVWTDTGKSVFIN